ncbi:MAG: hypothetical protein RLZZ336_1577, partial [Cyanobacteriota bacterium]
MPEATLLKEGAILVCTWILVCSWIQLSRTEPWTNPTGKWQGTAHGPRATWPQGRHTSTGPLGNESR